MRDVTFHMLAGLAAGFIAGALSGIAATDYDARGDIERAVQAERAEWSKCDVMVDSFEKLPGEFLSDWKSITRTPDGKLWCGVKR